MKKIIETYRQNMDVWVAIHNKSYPPFGQVRSDTVRPFGGQALGKGTGGMVFNKLD